MVHKCATTNESTTQPFSPRIVPSHHCGDVQYIAPINGDILPKTVNMDQVHTHVTPVNMIILHMPIVPSKTHVQTLNHATPAMIGDLYDGSQDGAYDP